MAYARILPQAGSLLRGGIAPLAQGEILPFLSCMRLH